MRSHPGSWFVFWISWCVYWVVKDAVLTWHEITRLPHAGLLGGLGTTLDVGWTVMFAICLYLNCVWYARARRRLKSGDVDE